MGEEHSDDAPSRLKPFREVLKPSVAPLVVVGLAVLAICAVALLLAELQGVPASGLFRDAARSDLDGRLAGSVSVIGVMALTAAAAIALFVAALTARDRILTMIMGIASGIAALDDQFMLHEWVPDWVPANNQIYAVFYGGVLLAVALSVYRAQSRGYVPVLLASGLFLGLSLTMDVIKDTLGISTNVLTVAEDMLKLFGIGYWLAFTALRGLGIARGSTQSAGAVPATAEGEIVRARA